ncbi:MAG: sigma 54-interacting transcriptional regulator [Myxococcota bacterium]|nr:sigma 54-interacting transcriptional regulator [Myxococcota bacterium]
MAIRAGALGLVLLALAVGWVGTRDSAAFAGRTAPGFLTFSNGFLAPPFVFGDRAALERAGVDMLDLVVSVDGRPLDRAADAWRAARGAAPGSSLDFVMQRPWGTRFEARLPVRRFESSDRLRLLAMAWIPGLLLLSAGALPLLVRPSLAVARVLFLWSFALSTQFGFGAIDHLLGNRLVPWSYAFAAVAIGAFFHLAVIFPEARWASARSRRLWLVAFYGLPLGLLPLYWQQYFERPASTHTLDQMAFASYLAAAGLLVVNVLRTLARSSDPRNRERARIVLLAPAAGVTLAVAGAALGGWSAREVATGFFLFTAWSLSATIALGIARASLFEFDDRARRLATAGVVVFAAALAYLGAFAGLQRVFGAETAGATALLSLTCLLVLTLAVPTVGERLERGMGQLLFPGRQRARRALRDAARELASARSVAELAAILVRAAHEALGVSGARLVLPSESTPAVFGADGPLPATEDDVRLARRLALHYDALLGDSNRPWVLLGAERGARAALAFEPPATGAADVLRLRELVVQAGLALANARSWDEIRTLNERLEQENELLREEVALNHDFAEIVGSSPTVRSMLAQIEQVAPVDVPVLVLGETGTGKELVARALHRLSARSEGPLVCVASAAIPETLFESELFGHERGAFTDARDAKVGRYEAADGGTLFLDDVDALPLAVQAKLLRALQEGEVQRLGATQPRHVDVRVVAASNRDLLAEVHAGRFREDLYYRLHVVPIELPPLRARGEDVVELAEHFAERESRRLSRRPRPLADAMREALRRHDWPGNVRELRNVIERAVVLSQGDEIDLSEPLGVELTPSPGDDASAEGLTLAESIQRLKAALIREALAASGGNQRAAADLLGLHRQSLNRMLRDLDLDADGSAQPLG